MRRLSNISICSLLFIVASVSMHRRALNNFTLPDGTFIPKNTTTCAALFATHRDEKNYANPNNFDGFRFVDMESWPLSEEENVKQMVRGSSHTRHEDICFMYFLAAGYYHCHPPLIRLWPAFMVRPSLWPDHLLSLISVFPALAASSLQSN